MKPMLKTLGATMALVLALLAPTAQAGQTCKTEAMAAQTFANGLALAQQTVQALEAEFARSGARVVLLGRAGQNLEEYGLRYSHLGWAYKTEAGPWRVLHKLNHCGTGSSAIYLQGMGEFFLDALWRQEAVWAVPVPALQAPLLALLNDPVRRLRLHEVNYNMVAYPWSTRYQQSNQWALETLAMAAEPTLKDREQAQAWLKLKGYQPTTLQLGALKRLGAASTTAHIRFDDHPNGKRFSDRIETVTVDSVLDWLTRSGLGSAPERLAP